MATFDQRGQHVTGHQYNVAHDINFGSVGNRQELAEALQKLKADLADASNAQLIEAEIVPEAEYQLSRAIQQVQNPQPDKAVIVDHLDKVKTLIAGITSASGLVTAVTQAIEAVHKLLS